MLCWVPDFSNSLYHLVTRASGTYGRKCGATDGLCWWNQSWTQPIIQWTFSVRKKQNVSFLHRLKCVGLYPVSYAYGRMESAAVLRWSSNSLNGLLCADLPLRNYSLSLRWSRWCIPVLGFAPHSQFLECMQQIFVTMDNRCDDRNAWESESFLHCNWWCVMKFSHVKVS